MDELKTVSRMIEKECQRNSLVDLCEIWEVSINDFYEFLGNGEARRTQPENKPLSLEELRQMERCPAWAIDGAGHSDYVLMDATGGIDSDTGLWDIDFYGMTGVDGKLHTAGWIAYKAKPEQEEK